MSRHSGATTIALVQPGEAEPFPITIRTVIINGRRLHSSLYRQLQSDAIVWCDSEMCKAELCGTPVGYVNHHTRDCQNSGHPHQHILWVTPTGEPRVAYILPAEQRRIEEATRNELVARLNHLRDMLALRLALERTPLIIAQDSDSGRILVEAPPRSALAGEETARRIVRLVLARAAVGAAAQTKRRAGKKKVAALREALTRHRRSVAGGLQIQHPAQALLTDLQHLLPYARPLVVDGQFVGWPEDTRLRQAVSGELPAAISLALDEDTSLGALQVYPSYDENYAKWEEAQEKAKREQNRQAIETATGELGQFGPLVLAMLADEWYENERLAAIGFLKKWPKYAVSEPAPATFDVCGKNAPGKFGKMIDAVMARSSDWEDAWQSIQETLDHLPQVFIV